MRERRNFYKGGFWHIISRGVAQQKIFQKKEDFAFYLYKTKETLKKHSLAIHSYNLISNHIHQLIEQTSRVPPSKFIASLHTSLAVHINKKYSRVGHLFQDRFKAKEIEEAALVPVSLYINLNKVLEKLQHFNRPKISKREVEKLLKEAERDPWSSYPVYLGLREDGVTQANYILSLISDDIEKARKEYRKLAVHYLTTGYFLKTRDLIFEI